MFLKIKRITLEIFTELQLPLPEHINSLIVQNQFDENSYIECYLLKLLNMEGYLSKSLNMEGYLSKLLESNYTKSSNTQTQTFKMESYIDLSKNLYNSILEFLEEPDESNQLFVEFCENIKRIEGDRSEMIQFLSMIKNISDNHHRDGNFIGNIKKIFQYYKEQIKQTLSNNEIFHIFENNKLIIYFLLKNDIITISEDICKYILHKIEPNGNCYCYFFYPELEKIKGEEQMYESFSPS